jgi:hypothetical protein
MVPWLIEHERWKLFQAVIDSEIPSLTEPLRALGIRINPPGLPVSPEFLRK